MHAIEEKVYLTSCAHAAAACMYLCTAVSAVPTVVLLHALLQRWECCSLLSKAQMAGGLQVPVLVTHQRLQDVLPLADSAAGR